MDIALRESPFRQDVYTLDALALAPWHGEARALGKRYDVAPTASLPAESRRR